MPKGRWWSWAVSAVLVGWAVKQVLVPDRIEDAMAPIRQLSQRQIGKLEQGHQVPASAQQVEYSTPLSRYDRLLARNPFAPVKEAVGHGAAQAAVALRETRWIFRGTAQVGVQQVAVLEETISKKVFFSRLGDPVDGFTLAEIREHEVLLRQGDRVVTVGRAMETP